MLTSSKIGRVFCVLAISLSLAAAAFADTIRLKDGSIIKGKIVSFTGGQFVVAIGEGSRRREMNFGADEVESIQFDPPQFTQQISSTSTPRNSPTVNQTSTARATRPVPVATPEPDEDVISIESDDTDSAAAVPASEPKNNVPPTSNAKPVELSVKVLADSTSNGWTNSGWIVKKGQRIRITGSGEVSLGKGQRSSPSGIAELDDSGKLVKHAATGALIAVIGVDNNDFIYVGAEREFTAARDGALFLGVNEGNLNDNTGSFDVKIEILQGQ